MIVLCEPPGFNDTLCMPCDSPMISSSPASTKRWGTTGFFSLIGHLRGGADRITTGHQNLLPPEFSKHLIMVGSNRSEAIAATEDQRLRSKRSLQTYFYRCSGAPLVSGAMHVENTNSGGLKPQTLTYQQLAAEGSSPFPAAKATNPNTVTHVMQVRVATS